LLVYVLGGEVLSVKVRRSTGSLLSVAAANLHSNGFLVIGARKDVLCFVMWIAPM